MLINARTLLRSDWVDASVGTQWAFYAPIFAIWILAVLYSFREYRKDRANESADALKTAAEGAEAARRPADPVVSSAGDVLR